MNLLSRLARLEQAAAAIHIEPARTLNACARIEELERLYVEGRMLPLSEEVEAGIAAAVEREMLFASR